MSACSLYGFHQPCVLRRLGDLWRGGATADLLQTPLSLSFELFNQSTLLVIHAQGATRSREPTPSRPQRGRINGRQRFRGPAIRSWRGRGSRLGRTEAELIPSLPSTTIPVIDTLLILSTMAAPSSKGGFLQSLVPEEVSCRPMPAGREGGPRQGGFLPVFSFP